MGSLSSPPGPSGPPPPPTSRSNFHTHKARPALGPTGGHLSCQPDRWHPQHNHTSGDIYQSEALLWRWRGSFVSIGAPIRQPANKWQLYVLLTNPSPTPTPLNSKFSPWKHPGSGWKGHHCRLSGGRLLPRWLGWGSPNRGRRMRQYARPSGQALHALFNLHSRSPPSRFTRFENN